MPPDTAAATVHRAAVLLSSEALVEVFIAFSTHSMTRMRRAHPTLCGWRD
jgi:hypothetical protein